MAHDNNYMTDADKKAFWEDSYDAMEPSFWHQDKAMCDVMRDSVRSNFSCAIDGNLSYSCLREKKMLITPSGVDKGNLTLDDISTVCLESGEITEGDSASGELELHVKLAHFRKEERITVLHLHPRAVIASMFAGVDFPGFVAEYPDLARDLVVSDEVPSLPACSVELADAVLDAAGSSYNFVPLRGHGCVAIAPLPWDAFRLVQRAEHLAHIALMARAAGAKKY